MMRETRGIWRGRSVNNWHYGDLIRAESENNHSPIIIENGVRYSVFPSTLGECTGLTDKNGKLIFEGDICKDDGSSTYLIVWHMHQWQCEVIHSNCVLVLDCSFPLWQWDNCIKNGYRTLEIIGNIHDNPELLKSKNKEDK